MATKTEQRKIQIIADGTQVNASMQQMQKSASLLWAEMKKLDPTSQAFADKSKQFQEVKGRLDETTKAAKNTEKSLGELANEAMMMSPLGGIINTATAALGKFNIGVKAVTTSTNLLKVAIASTGVGLLVIALGSLISYLTTTQAGIDKVNKVLTPMRVIFEKLQGVVQNLGGNLFKGLGELLNGEVKQGFNSIIDGAAQAGEELGNAFTDGIEQGGKLAQMNIDIEKTEIALTKRRAEMAREYKEANEIAENVAASEEDRREAAQRAIDVTNERLALEQDLIDKQIAKMELEQTFNDTDREGEKELQELYAQRIEFETQASEARTTARSKLNTVNQSIAAEDKKRHEEALKAMDEQTKKEEEAQKKRIELRKQYEQAEKELTQSLEDVRIAAMEEGFEKEKALLDIQLQRDLEALETKKQAVLANEVVTQEEKIAIEEQFAALSEAKKLERDEAVKEAQAEQREVDLEERMAQFDEDQEIETTLLETAMMNAVDAEFRKKEALLQIQREYAAEKLALLEASGQGESLQAVKLKNTIAQIDKDIADNKIAEAQRAEDFKNQIQSLGFENARTWMQLGLDLLGEESKARKVLANAMKTMEIGQVVMNGVKEVQAIWAGAATLGPIAGPIMGALQTGIAVGRTAIAVNKIRTTQYADGGATGTGRVIDMMLGRNGSWYMPNGQATRNVGSFARGGHVGSASFGVIGEAGSEWVGPNWMLRSPKYANIFGYLEAERRKATPFATGGATAPAPQIPQNSSATADLQQMLAMIEQFGAMNDKLDAMVQLLQEWPTRIRVYNDPRDIVDGVRVLNQIENDSRINR